MISFVVNLAIHTALGDGHEQDIAKVRLILGSPAVPAAFLAWVIRKVPESPRYYLTPNSRQYSPERAFESLKKLRNTRFQAVRDLYLTAVGVNEETKLGSTEQSTNGTAPGDARTADPNPTMNDDSSISSSSGSQQHERRIKLVHSLLGNVWSALNALYSGARQEVKKYWEIATTRRLRNAAVAACTANFCQQLSGINILAFYGGTFFMHAQEDEASDSHKIKIAMLFNVVFGLINFLFCLPALHAIDRVGRRGMTLLTIPFMIVFMTMAAGCSSISNKDVMFPVLAIFLFLHTAFYSPGLGPVPFTLAGEAFPLQFREPGACLAIATNFLFAGLLAWFIPQLDIDHDITPVLGIFSGLNVVALLLIFFLVEETAGMRLEDLETVFEYPKVDFIRFQVNHTLPWLWNALRTWSWSLDGMPSLVEVVRQERAEDELELQVVERSQSGVGA
ncbi:putative polyol transporter 1 [Madurella mycetomatis]|uniref:Polyol transporter 1 n=1 Tax=Madurella mycetomatis TaxID=100816 RepID=A0A175W5P1_9PEZI|nr:putative polyol transporter 1 [Madurella mycetomatis]